MFESADDFAAYLDRLAERAPKLRNAGVLTFEAGGIKAQLVPAPGDLGAKPVKQPQEEEQDAWENPLLYGRDPDDTAPYSEDEDSE